MITVEEMQIMLDEIVNDFPRELFDNLNGGILLLPQAKRNPRIKSRPIYILGEYHSGGNMGKYIAIYYGSFKILFGHTSIDFLRKRLTQTLKHEFIHHLETQAGERGLAIKDEQNMRKFLEREKNSKKNKRLRNFRDDE